MESLLGYSHSKSLEPEFVKKACYFAAVTPKKNNLKKGGLPKDEDIYDLIGTF